MMTQGRETTSASFLLHRQHLGSRSIGVDADSAIRHHPVIVFAVYTSRSASHHVRLYFVIENGRMHSQPMP